MKTPTTMKMFLEGANGTVTGSCTRLVYTCGKEKIQILVDCGFSQNSKEGKCNIPEWDFNPSEIHCVLLTHAHIDHSGAIPLLYERGFKGPVYATWATKELSEIMLKDSARTSNLYSEDAVEKIKWEIVDKPGDGKGKPHTDFFPIANGIKTCFLRSSHILGASSVYVQSFTQICETEEEKKQGNLSLHQ